MLEIPVNLQALLTQLSHAKLSMQITNTYNEPGISNLVSVIQQLLIIVTQQQENIATLKTQITGLEITKKVMAVRNKKKHNKKQQDVDKMEKPQPLQSVDSNQGIQYDVHQSVQSENINEKVVETNERLIGVEEHIKWISTVQVRQSKILEKLNNWKLAHTLDMVKVIIQDGTGPHGDIETLFSRIEDVRGSTQRGVEYMSLREYEKAHLTLEQEKQVQVLNSKSQSSIAMPALRCTPLRQKDKNMERPGTTMMNGQYTGHSTHSSGVSSGIREGQQGRDDFLRVEPTFSISPGTRYRPKTLMFSHSSSSTPVTTATSSASNSQSQSVRDIHTKGGGFHITGETSCLQKRPENHSNPINDVKLNVINVDPLSSDQSVSVDANTGTGFTGTKGVKANKGIEKKPSKHHLHVVDRNSGMLGSTGNMTRNSDRNLMNIQTLHSRISNHGFARHHVKGQTFEQIMKEFDKKHPSKGKKKKTDDMHLISDSLKILQKYQSKMKLRTSYRPQDCVRPTWKARLPGTKSQAVDRLKMKRAQLPGRANIKVKGGQLLKIDGACDKLTGW